MSLKTPGMLDVDLKGVRGLIIEADTAATQSAAFLAQTPISYLNISAVMSLGVLIEANKETPIPVTIADLFVNADVRQVTARFVVMDAEAGAPTEVKVKEGNAERSVSVGVDSPVGLQNVELRLAGGDVIWSQPGQTVIGEYQLPDFSAQLNAYLDGLPGSQEAVTLEFLVKSDTAGRARIDVDSVDYALIQTESWTNELDATLRLDRNVSIGFNTIETFDLAALKTPGNRPARLTLLSFDAGGQFEPERLLGAVETHDQREWATISPDYSIAQRYQLDPRLVNTGIQCAGISTLLRADVEAELYIEIQSDDRDAPATTEPLTTANLTFTPVEPSLTQPWTFVRFDPPIELRSSLPYWVVIKGVRGLTWLALQAPPADRATQPARRDRLLIHRGGQVWKYLIRPRAQREENETRAVTALTREGLISLVYLPQTDNQTAPVVLDIPGAAGPQPLDPGTGTQAVVLQLTETAKQPLSLSFRSHAQGTLSVANIIQEYVLT